jgi:F0F1-type ATP synthase membrane subunit b/b'
MNTYLLIFLLVDVFIAGVLATAVVRHALAHFWPHKHDLEKHLSASQTAHLPPALRQQLLDAAQADFQNVLKRAAHDLEKDLAVTSEDIKKNLSKLETETAGKEQASYQAMLTELEQQTKGDVQNLHQTMANDTTELKAKLAEEMAAEKQQLVAQIDTRLGDAVSSFLLETMQHNVDLGAQTAYIMSVLNEHKDELKKEVENGSSSTS